MELDPASCDFDSRAVSRGHGPRRQPNRPDRPDRDGLGRIATTCGRGVRERIRLRRAADDAENKNEAREEVEERHTALSISSPNRLRADVEGCGMRKDNACSSLGKSLGGTGPLLVSGRQGFRQHTDRRKSAPGT